jgi:hypothetical protein
LAELARATEGERFDPMSGGSYGLAGETFEMSTCELHPAVRCAHWEAVFGKAGRISKGEA